MCLLKYNIYIYIYISAAPITIPLIKNCLNPKITKPENINVCFVTGLKKFVAVSCCAADLTPNIFLKGTKYCAQKFLCSSHSVTTTSANVILNLILAS